MAAANATQSVLTSPTPVPTIASTTQTALDPADTWTMSPYEFVFGYIHAHEAHG